MQCQHSVPAIGPGASVAKKRSCMGEGMVQSSCGLSQVTQSASFAVAVDAAGLVMGQETPRPVACKGSRLWLKIAQAGCLTVSQNLTHRHFLFSLLTTQSLPLQLQDFCNNMAASENGTKVWLDVLAQHTALQEQYVNTDTSPAEVRPMRYAPMVLDCSEMPCAAPRRRGACAARPCCVVKGAGCACCGAGVVG